MEGMTITVKDSVLRERAESLLKKGDFVISLTAPTIESPFPLWIWNDSIKMWIGNRWKNVGIYKSDDYKRIRVDNGLIRLKD